MGKRLYVGNLPFETTEDQLRALFAESGQIASVKLITDKFTGRSKGFGFVEMNTEDEAKAAIQKLNGSSLGSRQIKVNEAKPMEERGPGGGGFGGGRGGYGGDRGPRRGGYNR
ncbi:MAG: RNA-binding protein [Elusimicrobia bacterium]|nr:RNA-binding protein [Elusimicrobiota bacterium]